jgi:hypothetical protein
MAYDLRCETARFATRKIRFVFAAFRPVEAGNETKESLLLEERCAASRLEGGVQKGPSALRSRGYRWKLSSRPLRGASERGLRDKAEGRESCAIEQLSH